MLAALAWQAEQDALCTGCGNPRDESMAPAHEEHWVTDKLVCFACRARARRARESTEPEEIDGAYYTTRLEVR
jgi:hypothetical protein